MTPPLEPRDPLREGRLFPGRWVVAGLVGAGLAALAIRALGFPRVFPGGGLVLLDLSDSSYHARRALYSFANFPAVLWFDAYIAYPDGAPVPMPPLYDWLLGGVARLFGRSTAVFEHVAAWASVLPSVATLLPVYALGRRTAGAGVGLGAAWLFALLPATSLLASLGNLDHHAAVTLLGALWLASSVAELRAGRRRPVLRAALHGAGVAALVLTWSGSLLYVLVGEGARLLVGGVLWSRRARLWAQSGGALLAAGLVAPWVAAAPEPIGGVYSSTTLSWLHVLVLVALAALAAALAALEARRPQPRAAWRALRAGALALVLVLAVFALPGLGGAVRAGAGFLSKQDAWAQTNPEQRPLFEPVLSAEQPRALGRFGLYAFAVPLAPLLAGLGLRRREGREAAALLVLWTAPLSLLALQQVRFAHDFAAPGAVVFAGALGALHGPLVRRLRLGPRGAGAALAALGLALLWPALAGVQIPKARLLLQQLEHPGSPGPGAAWESALRFAEEIRRSTPETSGFLDARERPEYGLLVPATLGHTFVYVARRPVPANNFGPYLDEAKFDAVRRFYRAEREDEAVAIAERLGVRFVVTADSSGMQPPLLIYRLHHGDGSGGPGWSHVERFRLVSEGPARGVPLPVMFPEGLPERSIPYKLFERVAGAVLEVAAAPGAAVQAEAALETPLGRRFVYRAGAAADAGGVARLRVPYATDAAHPVRTLGLYRVSTPGSSRLVAVPDAAVRAGALVPVAGQGPRQAP